MAKPDHIELGEGRYAARIPILYEDRSVLAIDKPAGWLLVPFNWQRTQRNLHAALTSSIAAGDFWARSRSLRFLRHVHRLDGETSGVLLLAKSPGALDTYGDLFESRQMSKLYLAVVRGAPKQAEWTCQIKLAPDPRQVGKIIADPRVGKEAETAFRLVRTVGPWSLIEARPATGRTHQIRVHLAETGLPVVGDELYGAPDRAVPGPFTARTRRGPAASKPAPSSAAAPRPRPTAETDPWPRFPLGLRAVSLSYFDPFRRTPVRIEAPTKEFLGAFGLSAPTP